MLLKKYKFVTILLYVFVIVFYTIIAIKYMSAEETKEEVISKKEGTINQWQLSPDKKVINRFSTFLFKSPASHPVKNKLLLQAKAHEVYQLTHSEQLQLFDEQLVDSELLYNDVVKVLEIQGDYAKIVALQQPNEQGKSGYEGWVFVTDLSDIPKTYAQAQQQIVITSPQINEDAYPLSMGSYLPVIKEDSQSYEVATLQGTLTVSKQAARNIKQPFTLQEMLQTGQQLVGTPYVWAGISSKGVDCSGLVYTLYRLMNIQLPRDTPQQAEIGQTIENYTDAQAGDILLFTNDQGIIHHVGIYLGNDKMLHAPNVTSPVEIMNIKGTTYEQELSHIRRIVQ